MSNVVTQGPAKTRQFTAVGTVAAGDVIETGDGGIGVYSTAAVSGDEVAVIIGGTVELTKETGVAFEFLDQLYWDATNNRLDKTNTNIPAGLCMVPAASGATTAQVELG